ncbi:MAG: hypothetical protein U0232_32520, partial [Thermomicrobiales bacterium]
MRTRSSPRRAQGRRFALPAVLTLAMAALLANRLSVLAIARWGARQRQIENGRHHTKDTVFGEGRSQPRLGAGPMLLAILRDHGQRPAAVVALLRHPPSQHASALVGCYSSISARTAPAA